VDSLVSVTALIYGAALNEGRKLFHPDDDKGFGQWVLLSQLETVSRDDRAAAMWAAGNPEKFAAIRAEHANTRTVRG
jgi:hypothetical protein